jgi:hypothetical protein
MPNNNTGTKQMLLRSILTLLLLIGSMHVALAADPVGPSTVIGQNPVGGAIIARQLANGVWTVTGQNPVEGTTATLILTDRDSGHQQQVKPGTIINIRLPVQFGTAYLWVQTDNLKITQIPPSSVGNTARPGGWQDQVFTFSTLVPGEYKFNFTYQHPGDFTHHRPGNKPELADKKVTFSFLVK